MYSHTSEPNTFNIRIPTCLRLPKWKEAPEVDLTQGFLGTCFCQSLAEAAAWGSITELPQKVSKLVFPALPHSQVFPL